MLAINGVLMVAVLLNYAFLKFRCHYIPESVCTISVGASLGRLPRVRIAKDHIPSVLISSVPFVSFVS